MTTSEEFHKVGREISEQIRQLRRVSSAYCGNKLVAAVVPYEGDQWIWSAGGRSGSHQEMMDEWHRTRDMFADSLRNAEEAANEEMATKASEAILKIDQTIRRWEAEHLPALVPPTAVRITERHRSHGYRDVVACRRCRHDHTLRMAPDLSLALSDE